MSPFAHISNHLFLSENKTRDRKSSRASKKGSKGKQSDTIPMEDRHGGSSDSEQEEVVAEPTSIGTLKKEKEVRAGGHDDGSSSESEVEERRERRDPPVEEPSPATTPRTSSFESSTPRDRSASDVHSGSVVSKSEFSLDDSWWIDYDELELVRLPPPPQSLLIRTFVSSFLVTWGNASYANYAHSASVLIANHLSRWLTLGTPTLGEQEDKVSESATATVYHGEYRGQEVAVKIFNPEMINREKLVKEFQMIRYVLATSLSPSATQHADALSPHYVHQLHSVASRGRLLWLVLGAPHRGRHGEVWLWLP